MKASRYLLPTVKDDPQDAVVASHKLMIRAGLVKKAASGLYFFLPLGFRILKKIEKIIREEMDLSGALEFELPILTAAELWEKSGRWDKMGKEMMRISDRHGVEYCLGPTHEESFSYLLQPLLKSYKDLPLNVYQIHTKFRDEIRPRFGVIRSREFRMKDAYSFHLDDDSLASAYEDMRKTYRNIFKRCGLQTIPVQADSGNMGGSDSEEFMVVSPIGEETLSICSQCGYAANIEKTPVVLKPVSATVSGAKPNKVHTPGKKTISEVADFLKISISHFIKAVAVKLDQKEAILVFLAGDRELNEHKLKNITGATEIEMLGNEEIISQGLVPGFIGPGSATRIRTLFDVSLDSNAPYVCGANEADYHVENFILSKEIGDTEQLDLCKSLPGDFCPQCGKTLVHEKGIEVGHIFKLGKKYTESFEIKVLDQNGKSQTPTMGCYGIGVNRTIATVIEQQNDEKGIIWPISIAPFEVCLVSMTKTDEEYSKIEAIYNAVRESGIEILWDDRNVGPGFKFKDSELIGYPIRLTFGKNYFASAEYSILNRKTGQEENLPFETINKLVEKINQTREILYKELEIG